MRIITFFITIILFVACKDNPKSNDYNPPINQKAAEPNPSINTLNKLNENIVWNDVKFKNFTFKLPSNFHLENSSSNYNRRVYIAEQEILGLSIDVADLPNGYENSVISDMITNLNDFGNSVNANNKRLFNDFQILSTRFSNLGNNESVEVTQTSTKVSGKNTPMIVKAHFAIANPYYLSITFSFPNNSFDGEQIINKIKNSFKFELTIKNETNEISAKNSSQPNLNESQDWILQKLNKYLI